MIKEDFYKLHIKQKIWFRGYERVITNLHGGGIAYIAFKGYSALAWDDVCKECSLIPPKVKVVLYRYTYQHMSDAFLSQSNWTSKLWENYAVK